MLLTVLSADSAPECSLMHAQRQSLDPHTIDVTSRLFSPMAALLCATAV